ncbi:hypothetical protein [Solibacillus sp. CAU 1738]
MEIYIFDFDGCAVTWGSHAKDKLAQEHPTYIIDEVSMLLKLGDENV